MINTSRQDTEKWQEVAPRIWVRRNPGFDMNTGLVIGNDRALIIDTGAGPRQAESLLSAVRELTGLPLAAVNTQIGRAHV